MGRYLDIIRQVEEAHKQTSQNKEPVHGQRCKGEALLLVPGHRITWQGSDGKASDDVIDFLQTYPGEVWAFCTRPDGEWCAVNVKYIRKVEARCD